MGVAVGGMGVLVAVAVGAVGSGVEVGTGVLVAVGIAVFVGGNVGDGVGVFVGIDVAVGAGAPLKLQIPKSFAMYGPLYQPPRVLNWNLTDCVPAGTGCQYDDAPSARFCASHCRVAGCHGPPSSDTETVPSAANRR